MWDDDPLYQSHFQRRVIYPGSVNLKASMNFPVVQIEMSIAKRDYAGLNLQQGDTIGLNIYYNKVNNIPYDHFAGAGKMCFPGIEQAVYPWQ